MNFFFKYLWLYLKKSIKTREKGEKSPNFVNAYFSEEKLEPHIIQNIPALLYHLYKKILKFLKMF